MKKFTCKKPKLKEKVNLLGKASCLFKKRWRYITTVFLVIGLVAGIMIFYQSSTVRGAVYGWLQTDWSGGADISVTASHPDDETGWTKYYSKDDSISTSTPGEISLASTTASWLETEDADFNAGARNSVYASSGVVYLLRPSGVACSAGAECIGGYCNGSSACDTCVAFTYSGQNYSVVMIGDQCWMAENLNIGDYVVSTDTGSSHSDVSDNEIIEKYCYGNDTNNCDTYGGLYDWDEMMGYVTTAGVQGICPDGWHLPTDAEWYTLEYGLWDKVTGACADDRTTWGCDPAGTALKSGGSSNFEGLLAGYRNNTGSFGSLGSNGRYWSSSEYSSSGSWSRYLHSGDSTISRDGNNKADGFSVRCLKD